MPCPGPVAEVRPCERPMCTHPSSGCVYAQWMARGAEGGAACGLKFFLCRPTLWLGRGSQPRTSPQPRGPGRQFATLIDLAKNFLTSTYLRKSASKQSPVICTFIIFFFKRLLYAIHILIFVPVTYHGIERNPATFRLENNVEKEFLSVF